MKKLLLATTLGLTSVIAQAAGYGVVDMQRVVENSAYLKQQNATLQQTVQPSTKRAEQLSTELQALQQKATTAKPAEVEQLKAQYEAKVREMNTLEQSVQQKVQQASQVTGQMFTSRVQQAADQLRKENNLDLVINKNAALAYDMKNDLTDKMIQKVNSVK